MNKHTSQYDNAIRQPLVACAPSQNIILQAGSLSHSMAESPLRPQRRYQLKKDEVYHSMVEENSIDSDGSNVTNTTTTTGD